MAAPKVTASFDYEKDTKTKVRFKERTDGVPVVGVLYVDQRDFEKLGKPQAVTVTITAA